MRYRNHIKIHHNFVKKLQEIKGILLVGIKYYLGDGSMVDIWRDKWIDNEQLKYPFQPLYEISRKKESSVKLMFQKGTYRSPMILSVNFRIHRERSRMTRKLQNATPIANQEDKLEWLWSKNKQYTVASCYTIIT